MIKWAYGLVDSAWGKILGSKPGAVFHWPVEITFNHCVVCHWWRGAMFGAAVASGAFGYWIVSAALMVVLAALVYGQRESEE